MLLIAEVAENDAGYCMTQVIQVRTYFVIPSKYFIIHPHTHLLPILAGLQCNKGIAAQFTLSMSMNLFTTFAQTNHELLLKCQKVYLSNIFYSPELEALLQARRMWKTVCA